MLYFDMYQKLVRSEQQSWLSLSFKLPTLANEMHFPMGRRGCHMKRKARSSDLLGRDASAELLHERKFLT